MRYILKQGVKLTKYRCDRCGQIELLSEEEKTTCTNCGNDMLLVSLEEYIPVMAEDPRPKKQPDQKAEPGAVTEITPEEKPKKKIGRPPKVRLAGPSCSTCSKALVAERGSFTCKIDCESKTSMDYCGKYAEGTPYGAER